MNGILTILFLTFFVVLHEFGHFLAARRSGVAVSEFFVGFGPKIFSFKKNNTEFGLKALPLGGYVKISGMIDESMDKEQMEKPAEPWEFRSKKAWQRLIIMIGGVTVNLLLGFIIYIGVVFSFGKEQVNMDKLNHGLAIHPYLEKYNLTRGLLTSQRFFFEKSMSLYKY